jgi:hypothetical protein
MHFETAVVALLGSELPHYRQVDVLLFCTRHLFITDQLNQLLLLTRKTHHLYIKDYLCITRNTRLSGRCGAALVTKGKFTLSREEGIPRRMRKIYRLGTNRTIYRRPTLTGMVRTHRSPTLILGSTSSTPLIRPPLPTRVKYGSGVSKMSSILVSPW